MQGVVVYARSDHVRPFGETDFDYLFGSASKPKNRIDKNAGLDLIASLLVGAPTQRQRLDRVALRGCQRCAYRTVARDRDHLGC